MFLFLYFYTCMADGMSSCPCTTQYTPEARPYANSAGRLVYVNPTTDVSHATQVDYGLHTCAQHDANTPECTEADLNNQPAWCLDEWCYVDASNCVGDDTWEVEQQGGVGGLLSEWFPNSQLRYSYSTCGTASYFAKYHAAARMTAVELFAVPDQYIKDLVKKFEEAAERVLGGRENDQSLTCEFLDSCACSTCVNMVNSQWAAMAVDLRKTTITFNQQERGRFESEGRCLGRQLQSSFRSIAQQTYNDPNRIAYMYFGLQENGAIIQWPATQWCPPTYDARFRPWYASAASGPKDVILTLDNSGSMMTNNRWELLKDGVKLVLRTLTEYDFIGVILFSSTTRYFKPYLVPATLELKDELNNWLDNPDQDPMGGTMFDGAMEATFQLIKESRANGHTTRCEAAVLFMTDGEDTSDFDVASFETFQKGLEPSAVVFTYTFGSGAKRDLPEQMACANKGVYWNVADGDQIGLVMSDYYKYFANGVTNTVPRWVTYADSLTGETLMAACLPAYLNDVLVGAGCVDVNMLIRLSTLRQKPQYPEFIRQVRDSSSRCTVFDLSKEKLDNIRRGAGTDCDAYLPSSALEIGLIVGGGAAGVLLLCCGVFFLRKSCSRQNNRPSGLAQNVGQNQVSHSSQRPIPVGAPQSFGVHQQGGARQPAYGTQPMYGNESNIPVAQAVY